MEFELTKGNLKKALLVFAIPLFFSQLFQTLYNTADTVIIGHCLGNEALAAVGSVAALFELIVGFCVGFGQGLAIPAAQAFGAGDLKGYRKAFGLSCLLAFGIAGLSSLVFCQAMKPILHVLQTPANLFEAAYGYIVIISGGLLITMFYNLLAAFLRAAGDSKTPLVILLISSLLNVVLDFVLILVFGMGVEGTAWATLIAQFLSLACCLIYMVFKKRELLPRLHDFAWKGSLALDLGKMGFSMGLMSSIVSIGTLILQTGINLFSMEVIAGHSAARKLIAILALPITALSMALSSFAAQNVGAGQIGRLSKGVAFINRIDVYYSLVLSVIVLFGASAMIAMISGANDPVVLQTGAFYLRVNVPFFIALALLVNLRTTLQSMSMTAAPVFSSIIELAGKVIFTLWIVPATGYAGVAWCEPVIWCLMMFFLAFVYLRAKIFQTHHVRSYLIV